MCYPLSVNNYWKATMAATTVTASYDDGLYHPPTPTASLPSSTAVQSTTITVATPAATLTPVLLIPSSAFLSHSDSSTSASDIMKNNGQLTSIATSTSTLASITPSARTSSIAQPETPRNSSPLILGVFIFLFLFLGVTFFAGYMCRNPFRRWRDNRRLRHSPMFGDFSTRYEESDEMLEVGWQERYQVDEEKEEILNHELHPQTPSDPFARSIPRRSQIQSYLASRNPSTTNPVEHIGNERGWLWGTRRSKASRSNVIPGLGTGHYRAKSNRSRASNSRQQLDDGLLTPSVYSASTYSEPVSYDPKTNTQEGDDFRPNSEQMDKELNEYLAESRTTVTSKEYAQQLKTASRSHGPFSQGGYLDRLKESISSRSAFSRSSRARGMNDSNKGRWNEIGQLEEDEDYESETERTVMMDFKTPTKPKSSRTRPSELSLADIPLPEVPLLAWDVASSPFKQKYRAHGGDEDPNYLDSSVNNTPVRRSTRGWTLSDQARPPASFTAALPSSSNLTPLRNQLQDSKRAEDREAIRNSLSMSHSQILSPELQPNLFFTAASPPNHHQKAKKMTKESKVMNALLGSSDQIYSLTGIAQLIFPTDSSDGPSTPKSHKMHTTRSTPVHSESYTTLPTPKSQRRKKRSETISEQSMINQISPSPKRTSAIKHRVPSREFEKELVSNQILQSVSSDSPLRNTEIHPGGFIGRSPTKKLKKKIVIGTSAKTNLQLKREQERAFDVIDSIVQTSPRRIQN
ncbi:uncharacterized protein MELLADRAFT_92343 [Melampsora larici-populina 98AG31]|uniref:Uncharacterized protein n=1 Tax=Melampsora larici-populina (strain 98AG31 / pathotype 3-4-7) TaxID=747676 RepID=F4R998_MELLP|nr:uncharacterized protein MELLADRAFT_92343 [Melampsora larici-populina 98AG31]EGG10948.1 hypothetical protein MELLADRAFT_92343 [Melampsora larici-populina 98AG31]